MAHNFEFGQFVCQKFFIFLRELRRSGTRFRIWAICVPEIFHFFKEIEEEWHMISNLGDLCAKIDRGRLERQRPHGTQNPDLPICVPKLTATDLRDSARLAHKTRKSRFVCQSYLAPGRETAPAWHTKPRFYRCGCSVRPQLCLFPIATVLARKVARPQSSFSLFAAV